VTHIFWKLTPATVDLCDARKLTNLGVEFSHAPKPAAAFSHVAVGASLVSIKG